MLISVQMLHWYSPCLITKLNSRHTLIIIIEITVCVHLQLRLEWASGNLGASPALLCGPRGESNFTSLSLVFVTYQLPTLHRAEPGPWWADWRDVISLSPTHYSNPVLQEVDQAHWHTASMNSEFLWKLSCLWAGNPPRHIFVLLSKWRSFVTSLLLGMLPTCFLSYLLSSKKSSLINFRSLGSPCYMP
jgi:hypothetical protein